MNWRHLEMLYKILILILVTFIPAFELRASIPLGILNGSVDLPFGLNLQGFGLNWMLVFLICVTTNIILGPLVYYLLHNFIHYFLRFKFFSNFYHKKVEKTQRKIKPLVKKYGLLGISLFIAIPTPGSGSYTGALAAYILGINYKKFILANAIGVLIAGILVSLASLGVVKLF